MVTRRLSSRKARKGHIVSLDRNISTGTRVAQLTRIVSTTLRCEARHLFSMQHSATDNPISDLGRLSMATRAKRWSRFALLDPNARGFRGEPCWRVTRGHPLLPNVRVLDFVFAPLSLCIRRLLCATAFEFSTSGSLLSSAGRGGYLIDSRDSLRPKTWAGRVHVC